MSDTPRPLPADQVDELLSAELDGEFDAAAFDLGLDVDDARARLAEVPGVEARRAALARARDALAELPPIDDLMSARLRTKATRAAEQAAASQRAERARGWQRVLAIAGAAAAVVVVVAGVAVAIRNGDSNNQHNAKASGAGGADSAEVAPGTSAAQVPAAVSGRGAFARDGGPAPLDFGSVPDVQTLAARVESVPENESSTLTTGEPEATSTVPATDSNDTTYLQKRAADSTSQVVFDCDVTARRLAGVTTAAIVRGVATLGGSRVSALLFAKGTEHVLVVLDAQCRLVNLRVATPTG